MRHITLRQIKIFESVARNLSFSRAAQDLHLTQPAVSMQVKQLEGLAGLPLFAHSGKRIALTEGGSLVLRHCQRILADLHAAEQSLADLMSGAVQRLRVGVITSGSRCFPHLIHSFVRAHGGLELELQVRPREQLLAMLHDEQLDLALMARAPAQPQLSAQPFAALPFVLVAAPRHALAGQGALAPARLGAECLLVRERGTDTRSVADDVFLHQPAPPRFMELGCSEAIKQSVMAGIGISLLAATEVQAEVRAGQLSVLAVPELALERQWHAVHCSDRPLPAPARAFRQFLLAEAAPQLAPMSLL